MRNSRLRGEILEEKEEQIVARYGSIDTIKMGLNQLTIHTNTLLSVSFYCLFNCALYDHGIDCRFPPPLLRSCRSRVLELKRKSEKNFCVETTNFILSLCDASLNASLSQNCVVGTAALVIAFQKEWGKKISFIKAQHFILNRATLHCANWVTF
jgi:hypothetical protein